MMAIVQLLCPSFSATSGLFFSLTFGTLFIFGLLKMSLMPQAPVPDPEPELVNAHNLDFDRPQLVFKPIWTYVATSHFICICILFNSILILVQNPDICLEYAEYYVLFEEPMRWAVKASCINSADITDMLVHEFKDFVQALPQKHIRMKCFGGFVAWGSHHGLSISI
jgi:hypothetical protein